jgi:hypothetical protein
MQPGHGIGKMILNHIVLFLADKVPEGIGGAGGKREVSAGA